uniref:NCK associated protein 5 like n=1 Tax=Erpetoichthys calabaricus TaxID=27687 RepID=A0A8C4SF05_ERPCA
MVASLILNESGTAPFTARWVTLVFEEPAIPPVLWHLCLCLQDGHLLPPTTQALPFAENSALSMANESQREAYERCLDEVANHVVQALLNQKDLREECIKLKMRVFDLERQNRTLSELFQQKLQVTAGSQVQTCDPPRTPTLIAPRPPHTPHRSSPCAFGGEKTRSGSHGPKAPTSSMEALSPFFKKKAHILEVLRKLEENDPLKFHPSSGFCPYRDFSQSNLDLDGPEHVNGEDPGTEYASCQSCLKFSHKGLDGLFKWKQETSESSSASSPTKGEKVGLDPSGPTMGDLPSSSNYLQVECSLPEATKSSLYASTSGGKLDSSSAEQVCNGLFFTGDACFAKKADSFLSAGSAEKSNRSFLQQASQGKAKVIPSPTSPCGMVDTKSSPISSPSKLLKFLKISSLGERAQAANPLRLSPQLTRSSKIPCRNNNYEVYHSPVLSRKTVPVEPGCAASPKRELAYSSHSAPKPTGRLGSSHLSRLGSEIQPFRSCQKIPHYENVSDISSFGPTDTSARFLDRLHQATFSAFGSSESLTSSPGPPSSTDGKRDSSPAGEPTQSDGLATTVSEVSSSLHKRSSKAMGDTGHLPFKERLAALGKLKSTEDLRQHLELDAQSCPVSRERSKTAERMGDRSSVGSDPRHVKYTDSMDSKPYPKAAPKPQVPEFGGRSLPGAPTAPKATNDAYCSKACTAKTEVTKHKAGGPSSTSVADSSQALRNYVKCSSAPVPSHGSRATATSPQGSPTKVPSKSPLKTPTKGGRQVQEEQRPCASQKRSPRACASLEDKGKSPAHGERKKNLDGLSSPAKTAQVESQGDQSTQSAIEEKVMKGIEENMLKLQELDKGQEWKLNVSSSSSSSSKDPKVAVAKKKLEAEGLNISKLMEKAEDLRKALEEERAFMNGMALEKTGRGHPCNVPVEMPTVYREAASDTFMQQLLNSSLRHLLCFQSAGMGGKDDVTSEESLGETVHSQHFTGSSTRTLDSGIGTFPLPDYASSPSGKGIPKSKPHCEPESSGSPAKHGPGTKMPRKARTLERELSSLDEAFVAGWPPLQHIFTFLFISIAVDVYGAHVKTQPSKNWTFPNSKASASTTDMYLGVTSELDIVHDEQPLHRVSGTGRRD